MERIQNGVQFAMLVSFATMKCGVMAFKVHRLVSRLLDDSVDLVDFHEAPPFWFDVGSGDSCTYWLQHRQHLCRC